MKKGINYCKLFAHINDAEWLSILKATAHSDSPSWEGIEFPIFPDEQLQNLFVGSSFDAALDEAYQMYRYVKSIISIGESTKLCDFGFGWGRFIRFFMKDIAAKNIFALDVDPDMVLKAKQWGLPGNIYSVKPLDEIPVAENSLDIFFAYSVFSHLSEDAALHWLNQAYKKLKPGGYVVITTEGLRFIDLCTAIEEKEWDAGSWHDNFKKTILESGLDPRKFRAEYENGHHIFLKTGGGGVRSADFYGWAIVPRMWLQTHFHNKFEIIEFNDTDLPQAVIIMQKYL